MRHFQRPTRRMLALAALLFSGTAAACTVYWCTPYWCPRIDQWGLEQWGYYCKLCQCAQPF